MQLAGALCGVGILCVFLFVTDAGFIFFDVVDYYVNFILILVGFFEVFGAGWIFGIEEQIEKIGKIPVFLYMFTIFGSLTFASIFWLGLNDNQVWAGFVALIVSYIAGMIGVYISCTRAAAEKYGTQGCLLHTVDGICNCTQGQTVHKYWSSSYSLGI